MHRLPLHQVLTTILMNNKTEQDKTSGTDRWQPVPCRAAHLPAQHCSRAASSVLASSPSLSTGRQRAVLALQGASLRGYGGSGFGGACVVAEMRGGLLEGWVRGAEAPRSLGQPLPPGTCPEPACGEAGWAGEGEGCGGGSRGPRGWPCAALGSQPLGLAGPGKDKAEVGWQECGGAARGGVLGGRAREGPGLDLGMTGRLPRGPEQSPRVRRVRAPTVLTRIHGEPAPAPGAALRGRGRPHNGQNAPIQEHGKEGRKDGHRVA